MLLLAAVGVLLVFLLAIKLCREVKGAPAFFVALLLCASPVFYAQAMLAQLDMPAMVFTVLATLLFLEEQIFLAAVACTALVLVKETGVVTPLLFACWVLVEKRFLQAAYFLLPLAALGAWFIFLRYETGHFFGSSGFTAYNLEYMMHPVRSAFALGKRLYYLGWENLHWIGAFGVLYAAVHGEVFAGRAWRIVWTLVALHILLFSLLGGAMLERYLLPVLPMVYIGMIAGWSAMPSYWRTAGPVALILAAAACNFWNPPYPFPLENNLAFIDFVRLQQTAASYIEQRYPGREVSTAWPLSAELSRPELGYVKAPQRVRETRDFSASAVDGLDGGADVFVLYSRQWDPPGSLMRNVAVQKIWRQFFNYEPQVSSFELDQRLGLKTVAAWAQGGHWIEVHSRD
jgi:hypothetical protein